MIDSGLETFLYDFFVLLISLWMRVDDFSESDLRDFESSMSEVIVFHDGFEKIWTEKVWMSNKGSDMMLCDWVVMGWMCD